MRKYIYAVIFLVLMTIAVINVHATNEEFPQDHCGKQSVYVKGADFSDHRVIINFSSGGNSIGVAHKTGYKITEVYLSVQNDGYSGFHLYATGPIALFNPNPGGNIDWAKVVVIRDCPEPTEEPTPTPTIVEEPTPTPTPEEECVECEETPTPTPTPEVEETVVTRSAPSPAGLPICTGEPATLAPNYNMSMFNRIDEDSVDINWEVTDPHAVKYGIHYGIVGQELNWYTEIYGHDTTSLTLNDLPAGKSLDVKVCSIGVCGDPICGPVIDP